MDNQDLEKLREEVKRQTKEATTSLLHVARLKPGQILVLGCSTSEVLGHRIGSASNVGIAQAILEGIEEALKGTGIHLAVQCCEHLNRALVVEEETAEKYGLTEVTVLPVPHAGGATAATALRRFKHPVVVEAIQAHAGIDIGDTLIGMHLRPVAVPVRSEVKRIGQANLVMARTRPKLIGGKRAVYAWDEVEERFGKSAPSTEESPGKC
ncbi:MAG TPA: TIGR01440 family protein [Firmicutes bacterium]|nr:TIGR01440 family protein [Candidatus Fermentithermobacillaceae bacterium]